MRAADGQLQKTQATVKWKEKKSPAKEKIKGVPAPMLGM
jgi:hypothetical protein